MEYVIWGVPPNKTTEELLMASSDGKPIVDIMFARFCKDQLEKVYNCSNVRIQTIDLNLPPDFFIGQQVVYSGITGKVISTNYHSTHPILVDFGSEREAFTKEGCLYGEDVELFGLEESDKPDQVTNDSKLFALLKTLLNTKTNTLSRIEDELQYLVDKELVNQTEKWFIEVNSEVRLLKHLIREYQSLEEGE